MDIVVSFVTEILNKFVDAAIQEASYPFRVNKYAKELQTEKDKLQSKIGGVVRRAEEAKKKTHKVVTDVETWLVEADSLMAKVMELQEKTNNRNKTSCLKHCPNLIKRYSLAKQLQEQTNAIVNHCRQTEFPEFSRLATLVGINYYSEAFIRFDSRRKAYDLLLEALKDDDVRMIGLYGMGGCGKTAMAKEVGKEAETFFNKVIFIAVSSTVKVREIQGKIASQLDNLELKEEEEPERAKRISMRLSSGERFLIILDDVWEVLNFENIGIPLVKNQKCCTTLITTRELRVCELMECKRIIPLKDLNEDEAWILFQKHAGTFDESSNSLKGLAQEITKECGGLPVAIAAVASSLKGKSQLEWKEALKTLRNSIPMDIERGLRNPYTCLQLSYDKLENKIAKSLFLLCSVFPEDDEMRVAELSIIGTGLGLVEEVDSCQSAMNQVIIGIHKLIDSCLLIDVDGQKRVFKMHDLVRDVALWIGKKENKLIIGREKSKKEFQGDMVMNNNKAKYLWIDEVDKLLPKLECSKLEFLYISTKSKHLDATNDFLKGMKKLKVLFLKNTSYPQDDNILRWPKSDQKINNLCCLFLGGWNLEDFSFVGNLERLECLILRWCCFDELPNFSEGHRNLRLLEVRGSRIQKNPYEVIGRCSRLKVLYFLENDGDWMEQGEKVAEFFDKISVTPTLESYCIQLGRKVDDFLRQEFPIARSLCVEDFETCISNVTIKDWMQRAEVLFLGGIQGDYKSVIPDVFQTIGGDMGDLTQLGLLHSNQIEYVLDPANHLDHVGIISRLTCLTISGMKHLKSLCGGQAPLGLYKELEFLSISKCDSLEHIIADEMEVVADDSEYQRSYRFGFPKLKSLQIEECHKLEFLMPISFAQNIPQLESLSIWGAQELKSVFSPSIHEDPYPNMFQLIIQFSALRGLGLIDLPNMVSIFPQNYHPTWPFLETLIVQNVPQLNIESINDWIAGCGLRQEDDQIASEELLKAAVTPLETLEYLKVRGNKIEVVFDGEGLLNNGQQVNSFLQYLGLKQLAELRQIWRGPKNFLLLQHLSWLKIKECGNLKVIFTASIVRNLPKLTWLCIWECEKLEEIIGGDEEEENHIVPSPYRLVFPSLYTIDIQQCHKLKVIFTASIVRSLPQLRRLSISKCEKLEEIIGGDEEEENDNVPSPHRLVFPNLDTISITRCHKLKRLFPVSPCHVLPKLRELWIEEASQLEQVFGVGDEKGKTSIIIERKHNNINFIPNLEYAILWKLPTFTAESPWIDLERVTYLVLHQCPQLTHLTTIPAQDLLQKLENTPDIDPWEKRWSLIYLLRRIVNCIEDCSRNMEESVVKSTSESENTSSHAQNNEQKLTPVASPNFTENVKDMEDQSGQETNLSQEKRVKGGVEESSTSQNATIVSSSIHSEQISSLLNSSVSSLPKAPPQGVKERVEGSASENTDIYTSSTHSVLLSSPVGLRVTSLPEALPHDDKGSFEGSTSENPKMVSSSIHSITVPGILVTSPPKAPPYSVTGTEDQSVQERNASKEKGDKGRVECSTTENLKMVASPAHLESANPIINLGDFEDDTGPLPIPSVPIVATIKDELVAKALADFEICLEMPLKDIATTESNSLRLLTALNFLSHLSFDDGALSHGLKATIRSLLQDFPSIMYSFQPAFATIEKFPTVLNQAQEKESRMKEQISRLEKEIEDCEAKISSLQEQLKNCVAEIKGFKKQYESVRKERSEMVEDQRKVQPQLLEADYTWSVLCSQFQHHNIDVRVHQIVRSGLEDDNESKRDCRREITEQIQSKETEVQAAPECEHLSPQLKTNQSLPPIDSPNLTKNVKEQEDQSVREENISKEHDVKGSVEGSASENTNTIASSTHSELASSLYSSLVTSLPLAFSHKQLKVNQTEVDSEAVAKAFVDLDICLKMPLKDIAISELNSLRLLTALNFLSRLSFEDGALSPGLKAIIQSLLQHFPSILYSFKSAFIAINKFPRFMNEAQEKEARLKEQISVLEKEMQDCEAKLSSLQDKKKKCVAETIELKKDFDSVSKEKTEMMEDQRKAQQELFQADYKWSVLCSQFQLNSIATRKIS